MCPKSLFQKKTLKNIYNEDKLSVFYESKFNFTEE